MASSGALAAEGYATATPPNAAINSRLFGYSLLFARPNEIIARRNVGRIARINRQVCDVLHGSPAAKRITVFLRCKMSAPGRFCCRSPLRSFLIDDFVAVKRLATGAGDDGAVQSRSGAVFLFISA